MKRGSIIRRGENSYRLKYDAKPDASGRRQTRYVTFRGSKADAKKELTRLLHQIDGGTDVAPSKLSFGQWAEHWSTNIAPSRAGKKACHRYSEIIRLHLNPAIGELPVQKLNGEHIDRLFRDLRRHDGKPMASATKMHIRKTLSSILSSAVRGKKIGASPMTKAQALPRARRVDVRILDDADLARLCRFLRDRQSSLYVPVLVAGATGMRRGELLGLRWRDCNLDAGTIEIKQVIEVAKDELRFKEPKTDRSKRTITVGDRLIKELRAHRRKQAERRMALGLGKDENDLVFTDDNGGPFNPTAFTVAFTRAVAAARLPHVRFHSLRHKHLTDLLRNGLPVHVVSARAGHSSPVVTLSVYAHVMPDDDGRAAALVDATLTKALGE